MMATELVPAVIQITFCFNDSHTMFMYEKGVRMSHIFEASFRARR